MRPGSFVYRFGPFELDPATERLIRGVDRVMLPASQRALLLHLVAHAGELVSTDDLARIGWGSRAVSENSVQQAISQLRRALGEPRPGEYIETTRNGGYRFVAEVARAEAEGEGRPGDLDVAPFRAFVRGRSALATLDRTAVQRARQAFRETIAATPDFAPAHVGLATASALCFEATRFDEACDRNALPCALAHARGATQLAPASGEAWSTLAFALYLSGEAEEAAVAACKAIALERDDYRHWLRLAYVSWGEERIRAARAVLALNPGLALAHWLIATVLIARGAFDAAFDILRIGCALQDKQSPAAEPYPAVGLHLLYGLVLAARGQLDEACRQFTCELSGLDAGQVYAHECAANTWYALGACHLRQRRVSDAHAAFTRALDVAPGHLFSKAALGVTLPACDGSDPRRVDAAIAQAIALARAGRHAEAAAAYDAALTSAPSPGAGWILPVEPVLDAGARPEIWGDLLTAVVRRAA